MAALVLALARGAAAVNEQLCLGHTTMYLAGCEEDEKEGCAN